MLERFRTMSPEEQQQFLTRMRERGGDTSAFEAAKAPSRGAAAAKTPQASQAQTIDALFAPLPPVESRGRAWLYIDRQLKPVALRLGISDGINTELLSTELQENTELAVGVTGLPTTARQTPAASGNPLMPGRGPGGGPGGRPGGGRGF